MDATSERVLYGIAKAPRTGHSKTRLCPPLRPEQAARLAGAFLQDTVAVAMRCGVDVRLICRDAAEQAALRAYVPDDVAVHTQEGEGLGAALESAFVRGVRDGYRAIGVLGTDLPSLPAETVTHAFAALDEGADVCLGPSDDGGYYLLVARTSHPALFRDMTWSTGSVAAETLARCANLGLRMHVVQPWLDVDDAASLAALRAQLAALPESVAAHTRATLRDLDAGR